MEDITHYLPGLALALGAVMLALMSPGPNILAVIGTSMGTGRRFGVALALGVAAGSFLWALVAVTGMTALLTTYASVLIIVKIAGGCYLLWLGYNSIRSALTEKEVKTTNLSATADEKAYFYRGLIIQMTNPKAALAMTAIVSIGIQSSSPLWVSAALVVGISTLSLIGHLIYAYTFSTRPVVDAYIKCRRWIEAALGGFFCFAGLKLLTDRS